MEWTRNRTLVEFCIYVRSSEMKVDDQRARRHHPTHHDQCFFLCIVCFPLPWYDLLMCAPFQCGPAHHEHGQGGHDGEGDDVVLFVGSGTTGAVAKLVSALKLDRKKTLSRFTRSKNDT